MTGAGIAAALAAAVANAFAVVLQASEARRSPVAEGMHASLLLDLAHRPRWLGGTALIVVGGLLQVLALALAPIALVQPALATDMLVLLAVARVNLRERVGPMEMFGAAAILAGLIAVVVASPAHSILPNHAHDVAGPVAVVGGAAAVAFAVGRWRPTADLSLVIGAGLAYSWADFASKLFAGELSHSQWALAIPWLAGLICFGALAFLEENSSLQRRPAVTVAPVIDAIKVPLPVLMALWAGAETWGSNGAHIGVLLAGLFVVAAGAATLGRSHTVARVSGSDRPRGTPARGVRMAAKCPAGGG